MNIGNKVKNELRGNFINLVSNRMYDTVFDSINNDIWTNISRNIWNQVLIAVAQDSINNSSNELIQ
jgi:hypothetical protein